MGTRLPWQERAQSLSIPVMSIQIHKNDWPGASLQGRGKQTSQIKHYNGHIKSIEPKLSWCFLFKKSIMFYLFITLKQLTNVKCITWLVLKKSTVLAAFLLIFSSNRSEWQLLSHQGPSNQNKLLLLFSLHSPHTSPFKLRALFQFRFFCVRRPIIQQAPFCGTFSSSREAHKEPKCLYELLNQQFTCWEGL